MVKNSRKKEKGGPPKRSGKNVGSTPGEKASLGLRVIGGRLRGSKLQYAGDNRVRPMKDRTREAVFNLISTASKGKHVIDLFAGTGALAIEALSRGAISATLIEKHVGTMRNLRSNIESLGLTECCRLFQADAFYMVGHPAELKLPQNLPWLVFSSPPYDFYVEKQAAMLEMLQFLYENAPEESVFVIESDNRFDFDLLQLPEGADFCAGGVDLLRRSYSPAEIGVYEKVGGSSLPTHHCRPPTA